MKNILLFIFVLSFSCLYGQDTLHKDEARNFYLAQQVIKDSFEMSHLYYKAYEWIGTKYKYAGESRKGIDCSGFAAEIYKQVYCKNLQGGSGDIYNIVEPIKKKKDLQEGDLVFFKIKKGRISHVGVYLANNKFVHASVHSGVVVSDLDEDYYKKYFFSGGRIKLD